MEYYKILESLIGFFTLTMMSLISYAYMNDRRILKEKQDLLEGRQIKFEEQSRNEFKEIKDSGTSRFEKLLENINELKVYIEKKFNEMIKEK